LIDYTVEPKSRKDLRTLANILRKHLGLQDCIYVPIVELLDILPELFDDFNYEIVPDTELGKNVHAETDVRTGYIKIKESVYERACAGEGRDRMTIAHELGHYFTFCFCGFKLQRNFGKADVPTYRQPEWQAKCFAGEFMVPEKLVRNMSINEISEKCGVSYDAAKIQYKYISKR